MTEIIETVDIHGYTDDENGKLVFTVTMPEYFLNGGEQRKLVKDLTAFMDDWLERDGGEDIE